MSVAGLDGVRAMLLVTLDGLALVELALDETRWTSSDRTSTPQKSRVEQRVPLSFHVDRRPVNLGWRGDELPILIACRKWCHMSFPKCECHHT